MSTLYTMSEPARQAWREWLKAGLARAGSSQQKLAVSIFGTREDGKTPKNTTEVNRFCSGDAAILERWFESHPARIADVATELDLTVEAVREKLDELVAGVRTESAWHPAFPMVPEDAALIPAPLEGPRGATTPRAAARDFVGTLAWPANSEPPPASRLLELEGQAGTSRRIAARQLREGVEAELRRRIEAARERDPARVFPEVVVRVENVATRPGPLEILIVEKDLPSPTEWRSSALRLGRWGPAQAVELARTLSRCPDVPGPGRSALESFAAALEAHPGWADAALDPDLVIRWLAEVARAGAPRSGAEARGLLTAGAWSRCQAAADGALDGLDQGFLDRFFALLAGRVRSPNDGGPWTRVRRPEALSSLAQALNSPVAGRSRREILGLLDTLGAPGRGKEGRLAALRTAVATASPTEVLAGLERGGVLRAARSGTVEAAAPRLAASHAARALRSAAVLSDHPELLVDPHGAWLVDELARLGVPWAAFVEATHEQPAELAADVALARLRFAWCSDAPIPAADLVTTWAAVLWSVSHGLFAREPHGLGEPWTREAQPLLKQVSWRFRDVLPLLGSDPVEDLRAIVPEPILALVARWRRTPLPGEPEREPTDAALFGLAVVEFRGRQDLEWAVRTLAPAQIHPAGAWWFWHGQEAAVPHVVRLQEVAVAGDAEAFDTLTGLAWLREKEAAPRRGGLPLAPRRGESPATEHWHELPPEVRLAWALHHGPRGERGWEVYLSVVHALGTHRGSGSAVQMMGGDHPCFADLVRLGTQQDRRQVEAWCARTLTPRDSLWRTGFPPELAWALAEELALVDLLEELARWPARVLGACTLEFQHRALALSWEEDGEVGFVRLIPSWPTRGRDTGPVPAIQLARLGLEEHAADWRAMALRAAGVLARLGRTEPLLSLWRAVEVADLPVAVRVDAQLFEILLTVLRHPSLAWRDAPLADLRALDPGEEATQAQRGWARVELAHRLGLPAPFTEPWIATEYRAAHRGLMTLLEKQPSSWPEPIRVWLGGSPLGFVNYGASRTNAVAEAQTQAAATTLLETGLDAPLDLWIQGGHVPRAGRPSPRLESANARAVAQWYTARPERLDKLWSKLLKRGRGADSEVFEELRYALLRAGSHKESWREDAKYRPECPRPFVISVALQGAETSDRLHELNAHSPSWAPVLRARVQDAPDHRSAARWAVRLVELEPGCVEIERSLRYWLLEDPTPWAGPEDWDGPDEAGRFVGGTFALLRLALARRDSWITEGLVRLWKDGLTRPWLRHRGHEQPEAAHGWWQDDGSFGPPTVVKKLAEALVERGRADVVVDAWAGPPPARLTGRSAAEERAAQLRRWLGSTAAKHAPEELLRARLEAWLANESDSTFPDTEAWELFDREAAGHDAAALAMARDLQWPNFTMVARTAPQVVPALAEARIRAGMDSRYVAWRLIADSGDPADEAPQAALAARRLLLGGTG